MIELSYYPYNRRGIYLMKSKRGKCSICDFSLLGKLLEADDFFCVAYWILFFSHRLLWFGVRWGRLCLGAGGRGSHAASIRLAPGWRAWSQSWLYSQKAVGEFITQLLLTDNNRGCSTHFMPSHSAFLGILHFYLMLYISIRKEASVNCENPSVTFLCDTWFLIEHS